MKRTAQLPEKLLHLRIAAWDQLDTFLRLKEVNEVSPFSRNIVPFYPNSPNSSTSILKEACVARYQTELSGSVNVASVHFRVPSEPSNCARPSGHHSTTINCVDIHPHPGEKCDRAHSPHSRVTKVAKTHTVCSYCKTKLQTPNTNVKKKKKKKRKNIDRNSNKLKQSWYFLEQEGWSTA